VSPAAGFLVRGVRVFHDCTHGSLFPVKSARKLSRNGVGLFVFSPFRRCAMTTRAPRDVGDLDLRGVGDIVTLTVPEYQARSKRAARYR